MASRAAARWAGPTERIVSTSAPAIFGSSRSIAALAVALNGRPSRAPRTRASNVRASTTPNTAIASRPATRATALLTPDATPAWWLSTAPITVVVSGATVTAMPNPSTTTAGKNVVQYEPPIPGRAYNATPSAAIAGPTVSGSRLPSARHQAARPSGQHEHDQRKRQQRRPGLRSPSSPGPESDSSARGRRSPRAPRTTAA